MNQGNTTSRPLIWEDEAPAESRFRRMQQGVPRTGRALPGMPLEMQDPDGDDPPRSDWGRLGAARSNWWRPATTVGRVFLVLSAVVVLSGFTTTGVMFKHYLERDARFRIAGASHIQATGLTEVSRAQMLPVFGEDIGRNVFFVPIAERRKELEAIPWVEHATVMRLLPDQIRVNLVERQPVAFTRHGQQIGLVDANGVLLDMPASTMAEHHYSFPVVTGIDPGDKPTSRQARMAMYGRMMAELDSNNQNFSQQISEIDLTDPEDARVLLPAQGTDILAHFGEDHFLERYQRYQAHIAEWRQQYPKLAAVDLRYEHQVVLEMVSGVSATQSAGEADAAKPSATAPTAPAKAASSKPSVKGAKPKSTTKPSSNSTKTKTTAAKNKAVQDKKRAQAKPVAQNANKQKPSPATHASAAQGQ
jgi:cell division protein FtsQ